jgi:hypothetical protein
MICRRCGAFLHRAGICGPCEKAAQGRVVNQRRTRRYDVLVMRPGPFGNPFAIGRDGDRLMVLAKFRGHLRATPELVERIRAELGGPGLFGHKKILGCCCAPLPCHGDTLAHVADGGEP